MKNITIIGAGAFGFAITKHLSDKIKNSEEFHRIEDHHADCSIKLFDVNKELIEHIKEKRTQKYFFPKIKLNDLVDVTTDMQYAVKNADILIVAIPTQFTRSFLKDTKKIIKDDAILLNCSKGIELSTKKLISEMYDEELQDKRFIYAALSGGMIASEFISGDGIFGAEIACQNEFVGRFLQKLFSSKKLKIFLNDDIIGVELAGALKNVISIASGIVDGLNYPYGSKTLIVTLGSYEIVNLSLKLGAKNHTFNMYTHAFGNDYIMSTTGNTRNRYFGELIGKGLNTTKALERMKKENKTVEGYYTAKVAYELCKEYSLECPIIQLIYSVLYKNKNPKEEIQKIMFSELEPITDCSYSKNKSK